jgi:hypothetical protein
LVVLLVQGPLNLAKIFAQEDGGGKMPTKKNADCMYTSPLLVSKHK